MINWVQKDVDEELVRNVMEALEKRKAPVGIRIWFCEENPLDAPEAKSFRQAFGNIEARMKVSSLSLFERNDTVQFRRIEYSDSIVALPALEIMFEDPDCVGHGHYMVGLVQGKDNVLKFALKLAKVFLDKYPLEKETVVINVGLR